METEAIESCVELTIYGKVTQLSIYGKVKRKLIVVLRSKSTIRATHKKFRTEINVNGNETNKSCDGNDDNKHANKGFWTVAGHGGPRAQSTDFGRRHAHARCRSGVWWRMNKGWTLAGG